MAQKHQSGNPKTWLTFEDAWLVLDIGSGHNPHPPGAVGKFFFSLYFYDTRQVTSHNVSPFANGVGQPIHFVLLNFYRTLRFLWRAGKSIPYTRFNWRNGFRWQISN